MKVFLLVNTPFDYGACPVSLIAANSAEEAHKIYMTTSDCLCSEENYCIEEFAEIKNVSYDGDSCILVDNNEIKCKD